MYDVCFLKTLCQGRSDSSNMNFLFWGIFLACLNPDPDFQSGSANPIESGPKLVRNAVCPTFNNISSILCGFILSFSGSTVCRSYFYYLVPIKNMEKFSRRYEVLILYCMAITACEPFHRCFPHSPLPPLSPRAPSAAIMCAVLKVIYTIRTVNYSICSSRRVS
jgi:hypothetical protein